MPETLEKLQRQFVKSVLKGGALAVVPGGTLSEAGALDVYRDGYTARLTQALGETFEACWWTLGDEAFFRYCSDYALRFPSRVYNLSSYGERWPAFLKNAPEARDLPFLPVLAAFEWEFKNLFHEKEESFADLSSAKGAPDLKLSFTPALRLFEHPWSVSKIWGLRKGPQSAFKKLDWKKNEQVLLYKREGDIYLSPLGKAEHALLAQLLKGRALSQAFSSVLKKHDLTPRTVTSLFALIGEARIVTRVELLSK